MGNHTRILAIFIPTGLHICKDAFYIIYREKCMQDRKYFQMFASIPV